MAKVISLLCVCCACFLLLFPEMLFSQEENEDAMSVSRESIPEDLLRPRRGEAPRYASDMVIGPLGQGESPAAGYMFARKIAEDLITGETDTESLRAMDEETLSGIISILEAIGPRNFRLGGGRVENDGSVSFLVRFIGRELSITGELYIRQEETRDEEGGIVRSAWLFEELILDDAQSRKEENDKAEQRFDFTPYHRFY